MRVFDNNNNTTYIAYIILCASLMQPVENRAVRPSVAGLAHEKHVYTQHIHYKNISVYYYIHVN